MNPFLNLVAQPKFILVFFLLFFTQFFIFVRERHRQIKNTTWLGTKCSIETVRVPHFHIMSSKLCLFHSRFLGVVCSVGQYLYSGAIPEFPQSIGITRVFLSMNPHDEVPLIPGQKLNVEVHRSLLAITTKFQGCFGHRPNLYLLWIILNNINQPRLLRNHIVKWPLDNSHLFF